MPGKYPTTIYIPIKYIINTRTDSRNGSSCCFFFQDERYDVNQRSWGRHARVDKTVVTGEARDDDCRTT